MRVIEALRIVPEMSLRCCKCGFVLRQDDHGDYGHPLNRCGDAGVKFTLQFDRQGFLKLEEVGRS